MSAELPPLLRDYADAWTSGDPERIAAFFTDDCVYEDVALGRMNRGKAELLAFLAEAFRSFPDFSIAMSSAFVAGDNVGTTWTMTGTHRGDLPGLPATNMPFSIRGASIIELQGEKIRRNHDFWDQLTLLQQLGVIPPLDEIPT